MLLLPSEECLPWSPLASLEDDFAAFDKESQALASQKGTRVSDSFKGAGRLIWENGDQTVYRESASQQCFLMLERRTMQKH